jgi:hypothetical protein
MLHGAIEASVTGSLKKPLELIDKILEKIETPFTKYAGESKLTVFLDIQVAALKLNVGSISTAVGVATALATIFEVGATGGVGIIAAPASLTGSATSIALGIKVFNSGLKDLTTLNDVQQRLQRR